MDENNRYQILKLETPNGIEDSIIQSLATLHATKYVDERGRQKWIYTETQQIRNYTNTLLSMDSPINESIGKKRLAVCDIEKGPRVVRTGDGICDYQEAHPDSIVLMTPMTHNKARIWLAQIGEPFSENNFVEAGKEDIVIILPDTKFRLRVPYYLMVRAVRNI